MSGRFETKVHRDPRARLRAERTRLADEDVDKASDLMQVTYARVHAMLAKAEREAEETLEAARATGRGIVAEAERDAAAVREHAALEREHARNLLSKAKAAVAKARKQAEAASRSALPKQLVADRAEPAAASNGHGPIDLNEAAIEDLRAVGLSITQARRAIARRDRDGAYARVDQLAELPGMPAELLERIKPHLRV